MKPRTQSLVLRLFPVLVASLGLLALVGWVLGTPTLANLGARSIPMAPSTAVLFVAFAVALFSPADLQPQRRASRTGLAISVAGAVVALLLLVLSLRGIRLEAEHAGVAIEHVVNAPAIGHMSPVTAASFLLVALSCLAAFTSGPDRPWLAAAAKWLGGLLLAVSLFVASGYLLGRLVLYESSFIPPAAPTSAAFLLLAISLLAARAPGDGRGPRALESDDHTSSLFIAFVALGVAGVAIGGRLYYQSYARHFRAAAEGELSAIAELKVGELTSWRSERIADGAVLHDNAVFASLVRRWLDDPADKQAEASLRNWLASIQTSFAYDRVSLLDAQGVGRLSVPATSEPLSAAVQQRALAIQRSGRVAFVDFFRDGPTRPISLAVVAPILDDPDRRPLGSVVLRIDPRTYLYPFISRWPAPSGSAETLLIRRDGADALFLNTLRFAPDAALTLRFPLTRTEMPAVKAALGQRGIVEGSDYHGTTVVAALRSVPNSPWALVARMDVAEVYAPLQERFWLTIVVLGTMLASAATAAMTLRRRQQRARQVEVLEQEVAQARLLRLFYDMPFIGIARTSPDTRRLLQFNDRLCELVGYPREELATLGWPEITHPQDLPAENANLVSVMRGDSDGFSTNQRFIRKDGATVFASVDFKCVRRADGAADYLIAMVQDITGRTREELERQVLHEVARSVATTASLDDALWLMHRSLRQVLQAENCFVALHDPKTGLFSFPYFADQHDSAPLPTAMPSSCSAYVFRTGKPALITPTVFRQLVEQNEVALVGSPSPSWMGVPLRTPSGMLGVLVVQHYEKEGIYDDRDLRFLADVGSQAAVVIERKQAEVALRDSEAELNVILESTADGILAVDGDGKVIKANRRFAELWRLPQSLVDSGDDDALLHHVLSQLERPEDFLAKVQLLYGSADEDRDTLHFKDGRVFERHSAPISTVGGILGRVWSFHDITKRTQAEAVAGVLRAELHQAQKLESVGLLAGGVSHEFNNLLAVILGNTELALKQVDPSQQVHADLVEVKKAAERSAALTRQLLAFARSQPVAPRVMDLNDTVPGMLATLRGLMGEDIRVVWQPAPQLWVVALDPSQVDQILTNLCANARTAMTGTGTLTITTANRVVDAEYCATHTGVVPGEYVRLTVADTGRGMDARTLKRVFEPFFTTRPVGKGTGLGLAFVYGAVKQNDGFIMVSSEPGEGTTFEIHLPRHVSG